MAKHGGNGGKGKNCTTKEGAKISESRARARVKIDDKTWRKWGQGQKRHLKLRQGKNMSFEGKGKILIRHNRHQCEGKAHVKDDNLSVKNDVDSMRVT